MSDEVRKKGIFFEIGLIIALASVLLAFSWKTNVKIEDHFIVVTTEEQMDEEIIPVTQRMQQALPPPPPAPRLTDLIEIVDEEIRIDESLDIIDAESTEANHGVYDFSGKGNGYSGEYGYGDEYGDEYSGEAEVFAVVEEMPRFPGGDAALLQYIGKSIKYPVEAQASGMQGRVIVSFVVNKDGSICDAEVVRGIDPLLDREAMRVINAFPTWRPGHQRGRPVRVKYTVPITFRLS